MIRATAYSLTAIGGLAGFVLLTAAPSSALVIVGIALLGCSLFSAIAFTLRLGHRSLPDREREARAREIFEQTGRWPGDQPS